MVRRKTGCNFSERTEEIMTQLEVKDLQGFLLSSYSKKLPCATYLLLKITDSANSRKWLNDLTDKITTAEERREDYSLNIAFTSTGLKKLGLSADELSTFSRPFQEGMTAEHRSHILSDKEDSAPQNWNWGNHDNPVDVLVLVFAFDENMLTEQLRLRDEEIKTFGGLEKIMALSAGRQPDAKEHFGFLDGVGQPVIEGTGRESKQLSRTGHATIIKAGEFILGYENEMNVLVPIPGVSQMSNFGANGTYLVFRQMQQHVAAFWKCLDELTRDADGKSDPLAREKLGAKIVGRWKSGAPITKYRDSDPADKSEVNEDNDFDYHQDDAKGFGCPIGAHIRRSNPRDSLSADPKIALQSAKRHRIIRRGRSYGDRTETPFEDDGKERGLHFICLNSNIERQFEFIQQTWINNKTFAKLYDEVDPLIGRRRGNDLFTVQGEPIRTRVHNLDKFVTVKGGAYFFMPGISALRYLAGLENY